MFSVLTPFHSASYNDVLSSNSTMSDTDSSTVTRAMSSVTYCYKGVSKLFWTSLQSCVKLKHRESCDDRLLTKGRMESLKDFSTDGCTRMFQLLHYIDPYKDIQRLTLITELADDLDQASPTFNAVI